MNAQVAPPTDLVDIEIDGKPLKARKGSMIIQAADTAGIPLPRFCYHHKLPIAGVCRQCMVEVEVNGRKIGKPQIACATPVAPNMKVFTKTPLAIHAQQNALEFVLINHPLDCPVCDQGGECELQDLAMGYGRSVSRFTERKRSVADEDIGPLVATYMTRCIHCTRCVRFLSDIAGTFEFGDFDRGDRHVVGTYIGSGVSSELSGNIIDVCPVGALTNKPFQFKARAWELVAKPSIGYHDALGSNLWLHTRRGEVLRTVPRENEPINECWLSDRDRYSCEGLYADDRVVQPQIKRDGAWQDASWEEALEFAAGILKAVSGDDLGVLVHPATSNEEGALLKRLATGLGSPHIDHRLHRLDFSDAPSAQPFGMPVEQFDKLDAALVLGSDLRAEMPLLHQRLRQASKGIRRLDAPANRTRFDITKPKEAALHVLNPVRFSFNYTLASETIVPPQDLVAATLGLAKAAAEHAPDKALPGGALGDAIGAATVDGVARTVVKDLAAGDSAVVLLGAVAAAHPQAAWLRAATRFVAEATGAAYAEMPLGANAIGLTWQDVLPGADGLDAHAMLEKPRRNYIVYGAEPPQDFADGPTAMAALQGAERVLAFTAYAPESVRQVADVILPIALMPETDATLVNVDGIAQDLLAGAGAPGDSRAGWKALRALGGMLELDGFTFTTLDELREQLATGPGSASSGGSLSALAHSGDADDLVLLATTPIYRADAVLRRAKALTAHPLNRAPAARMNRLDAERLGLADGERAQLGGTELPVAIDTDVPAGCVWVEAAHDLTATLPPNGTSLHVSKA